YPLIKPVEIEAMTYLRIEKNQVSNKVFGMYSLLMLFIAGLIVTRAFRTSSQGIKLVDGFLRGGRK
ncbi:MAG: hypothetical protein AAGU16_05560, partial [Desulfitobacterium hafniense]